MLTVRVSSSSIQVLGDGVSTELKLSLREYPFTEIPPGKITAITLSSHPFDGDSVSYDSKTCTVTFAETFSGPVSIGFNVVYDPS